MSETKWSPGPWHRAPVINTVLIHNHRHIVFPVESEGWGIATCILPVEDDTPEQRAMVEANATLIVAAPDLYEAVQKHYDSVVCVCKLNAIFAPLGAEIECTKCELAALLLKVNPDRSETK